VHLIGFYYHNKIVCIYVCNVVFLHVPFHKHVKILNLNFRKWGGTSTMLKLRGHSTLKSSPAHTTEVHLFPQPGILILQRHVDKSSPLTSHATNPKLFLKETQWYNLCTEFNWTYRQQSPVLAYMQLVLPSLSYVVPNALLLFPPS
jgi:hypothetical protein